MHSLGHIVQAFTGRHLLDPEDFSFPDSFNREKSSLSWDSPYRSSLLCSRFLSQLERDYCPSHRMKGGKGRNPILWYKEFGHKPVIPVQDFLWWTPHRMNSLSANSPGKGRLTQYMGLRGVVFWNSIHLEVASDSFCFLINSSWLLVFILYVFSLFFCGFNLYCWKGIHFS